MLTSRSSRDYCVRLQFGDADSCVAWLENEVPLSRSTDAHDMITAQLILLQEASLSALDRLRILEVLYQAARELQDKLCTRYTGSALPLSIVEFSVWSSVVELWQTLHDAYAGCMEEAGDSILAAHSSLVGLRCIEITGAAIREHHRVYRSVPAALWRQMHNTYAAMERLALSNSGVADPLNPAMPARTCTSAYAAALLGHLSNPYTMSARQMQVTYRWANQWASLVSVQPSPVAPAMTPVLSFDLRASTPPSASTRDNPAPTVRYVVLEQLGQTLRRVLTLLRQGHVPRDLGLGDDVKQPGCERLLTLLYVQWCGSGMNPLSHRRDHGEDIRACVGYEAIARQLASEAEAFRASGASPRTAYGPLTEHWNIASVNAPGFIGVARGPECDSRIRHHQIVALKRRGASGFQLGVVQWLKREDNGELTIGLRLLPGMPILTSVKSIPSEGGEPQEWTGMLLPAAPEMRTPTTLVLPPGVFAVGRTLTLATGGARNARLLRLAERGADFERAVLELS